MSHKIKHIPAIIALSFVAAATVSCSQSSKWKAEGTIAGGEGKELILEASNRYGQWYAVDTVTIDKEGRFKVAQTPSGHPEIYRLTLGNQSIYFPIDSTETVTITGNATGFGNTSTLSGSASAERMQAVNDIIKKAVATRGERAVATDADLKRALANQILGDPAGVVAYYTIFRKVGNTQLFNPEDRADLRVIGAVANAYVEQRPTDPRTEYLSTVFMQHRRGHRSIVPTDTIVATEMVLPEISLLDPSGTERSLSEEASKGKVVVLNFTAYTADVSPALNLELAKVYDAYKDSGLEIYQVSVDNDEFAWRQAAANIPWTAVYNSPKNGARTLLKYNVTDLPATFVINRQGELVERVNDITGLDAIVRRYL
ncbi:MAG: AhpC/TSA family protein [Bacteroidales bacterium]|nr:AhpC/TSA family protein [Bacteroidales bacterium]